MADPVDLFADAEREKAAFLRKRAYLTQHAGEFVAIHNGEVEAADKSRNATLRKFFAKYPAGTSLYLGFVGMRPIARVPTPIAVRHRRESMPRLEGAYTSPLDDAYPGPYVMVSIAHGEVVRELQAVLDSGSDITVIPERTAEALKLQLVSDDLELHDASGGVRDNAPMYVADLQFGEFVVQRLAVTTTPYPVILIGRDILNRYLAVLDGPNERFTLQQD